MVSYQDIKYVGKEMIAVAFDIGTTSSAVSYAYLYPGEYPRVKMVTSWPGQPEAGGSSKIPTIVAYQNGQSKACGAEALEYVDNTDYDIARCFKLHLHPSSMDTASLRPSYASISGSTVFEIPFLSASLSIHQVYTDFMRYLMQNAQRSFEGSVPNGDVIWRRLRERLVVILTTPNGWDFHQQSVLRKAAIAAGLIDKEMAYDLLEFVTEGEASVHYVLAYTQSKAWLKAGSTFAVIDAGGSTVDSTLYECTSINPTVRLEEVCPSECIQTGGTFIDGAAEAMFRQKLSDSEYGDEESINDMVTAFESGIKRQFDAIQTYGVLFGGKKDNDKKNGILKGRLSLTKKEVASTFEEVMERIKGSCLELLSGHEIAHVLLVGGLGESSHLRKQLGDFFRSKGTRVVTVEEPTKKAAAEGATIWYIKQSVTARVARVTLGVETVPAYNPENPEHRARKGLTHLDNDGVTRLRHRFQVLIKRGTKMQSDFKLVDKKYVTLLCSEFILGNLKTQIFTWSGDQIPGWITDAKGNILDQMSSLCHLEADLSGMKSSLSPLEGPNGPYYRVPCKVAIRLGGTQLQAKVQWEENGVLREGPVSILPNVLT